MEEETLKDALLDIQAKLKAGDYYRNEEHVRLSLVTRVFKAAGWDVWNPKEYNTEYYANEDRGRVDITLLTRNTPQMFVEVKTLGQLIPNLAKCESQLEEYNRRFTAPFGVLTDGEHWRFYYTYSPGNFSDKCFHEINLKNSNDDTDIYLLLSKESIEGGSAEAHAKEKLTTRKREVQIRECIAAAKEIVRLNHRVSLVAALIQAVNHKLGFTINEDEADLALEKGEVGPRPQLPPIIVLQPQQPKPEVNTQISKRGRQPEKIPLSITIGREPAKQIAHRFEILSSTAEWLIKSGRLSPSDPIIGLPNWQDKLTFEKGSFGNSQRFLRELTNHLWIYSLYSSDRCLELARKLLDDCGFQTTSLVVKWVEQP